MQKASSGFPSRVLRLTSGQTTLHFTKITANYLQMCSTVNTLETTFNSVIDGFIFSDIGGCLLALTDRMQSDSYEMKVHETHGNLFRNKRVE